MSKILSVALFASYAAAQTTAQVWMPGLGDMGISYEGSVVSVDNDRTIMSVAVQGITLDDSLVRNNELKSSITFTDLLRLGRCPFDHHCRRQHLL